MSTAIRFTGDGGELPASQVHDVLRERILVDGFDLVLDLERSRGTHLVDQRDGTSYLDMFGFFASSALGMNHPELADDDAFRRELAAAAVNKPSNSDIYTVPMARFVETFARVLGDPALPHLFFIDGGALAVENALKVAFDWKSRLNESRGLDPSLGTKVLHLTEAFHGRSGYTMSLTNTEPGKVARYPKFDWPRIDSPYLADGRDVEDAERRALDQARRAFAENPSDVACFIAEPIQGEGGDHHFRPEFFQAMEALCRENDALFIFDEVQTGCGLTGTAWAYQQMGVHPDVVAFGKKTQVCGIMAGGRVDDIPDNVFAVSSRINSTWGGNLTDMVRSRRILEIVEEDRLVDRARMTGAHLLERLRELARANAEVTEPRGRGLMCAITLPTPQRRDRVVAELRERERVLILSTGKRGIRFRPPLTVTTAELDAAVDALARVLGGTVDA
ncbi:L-lysine 6-transaminase [Rhodococcus wratislaviensis]|uniref:L-lysine-epsilon aminotransferase n=1 Tax=Rhodococcus wratislaviensis NBRC 100605 TaxID=1219028 RepID=X0Q4D8_RHOWR|nr:L-lysine 6-transaminase [Rhodococcus wratislaviensis]GAF51123.1 L-lysine-epsilon aminotransferase [Rhodococcus wratislaviensis NBRC 100605]